MALSVFGIAGPAIADTPAASITKALDSTQGTGYTAPNTFETGSLVRYRLAFQCSSLTVPCNTGTITDVLDPNLDFVQVIPPSGTTTQVTSSWDPTTHTVTANLTDFAEGTTSEVILIARVLSAPPDGSPIPNHAQIQLPDQAPVVTPDVLINVPAPTPDWAVSKRKSVPAGDVSPDTVVTFHMELSSPTTLGNEAITTATFVDHFPVGAIIVDPDGGTVDYAAHTITWVEGPFQPSVFQQAYKDVQMKFPSTPRVPGEPAFSPGDTVHNTYDALVTYADGSTGTLTASADVPLVAPTGSIAVTKTGQATYAQGRTITWNVSGKNTGTTDVANPVVTDEGLPLAGVSNLYLAFTDSSFLPNGTTIYEQEVNGTWLPLATYTLPGPAYPWGPYPLDPNATAVRARPASGTAAAGQTYGAMKIWGTVTGQAGSTIQNCADGAADGNLVAAPSCVTTTVTAATATVDIAKTHTFADSGAAAVTPGTQFDWNFGVANLTSAGPLSTFTLADTLPAGFTYVGVDCIGTYGTGSSLTTATAMPCASLQNTAALSAVPAPTVTPHADGTTGLSWSIDLTDGRYGFTEVPANVGFIVKLKVQVAAGTSVGNYVNNASVQSPNPLQCRAPGATTDIPGTDPYDYDGDGSTADYTCNATDDVDVAAAAIIDASKWDAGAPGLANVAEADGSPSATCPDWNSYTRYPCVAQTTPGGPISYRFRLQNIGNVDATNYVMYDILPTTGDTGVSQLLSTQGRGTDWVPVLTGPVTVLTAPAGANPVIEYNLTSNPCRPELNQGAADGSWQASCDDTWYSAGQISDWSTVKSFRIKAFQPVVGQPAAGWAPLDEFDLQADLQAPLTAPTSTTSPLNLSIAWNSFAHREFRLNADGTTARLLASEPRKVGVIIPFVLPDTYAVGDYVWYDADHDGVQDAGEAAAPGVGVTLETADGTVVASTTTDGNGHYVFDGLPAGSYKVVFSDLPAGYQTTAQNNAGNQTAADDSNTPPGATGTATTPVFQIGAGLPGMSTPVASDGTTQAVAINRTIDAGLIATPSVSVGDFVWVDTDYDGIQDSGEPGIGGVTLVLTGPDGHPVTDIYGNPVGTITTGPDGKYSFDDLPVLPAGQHYTVSIDTASSASALAGYTPTAPDAGSDRTLDSSTGSATSGDLTHDGDQDLSLDFGFVKPLAVGDYVWYDADRDGIQDQGELPVEGATVTLLDRNGNAVTDANGAPVPPTTTDEHGHYVFDNLLPGDYTIAFSDLPAGYQLTGQSAADSTVANDSNPDASTGVTPVFTLAANGTDMRPVVAGDGTTKAGQINPTIDAGIVTPPTYAVGDYVWYDADKDGVQDAGEAAVPGVTVTLQTPDGTPVATTTTDSNGHYVFDGLPAGSYQVAFSDLPAGYQTTAQNNAGNQTAADDSNTPPGATATATTPVFQIGDGLPGMSAPVASDGTTQAVAINRTIDAGLIATPTYAVGDYVWNDADRDGIQGAGESPVPGVTVELRDSDGDTIATTTTDEDGYYHFDDLPAGTYSVKFGLPDGYQFTGASQSGSTPQNDSNADDAGVSAPFVLGPPAEDNNVTPSVESDGVAAPFIDRTIDAGIVKIDVPTTTPPTTTPPTTTPPAPASPTAAPSARPTDAPTPALAFTGAAVTGLAATAAVLLGLGLLLLLAGRRRRETHR